LKCTHDNFIEILLPPVAIPGYCELEK